MQFREGHFDSSVTRP
nr:unnamed protein product [Callosobruchus chinensis]